MLAAAQLYAKPLWKGFPMWKTVKVTQGHRKLRNSIGRISLHFAWGVVEAKCILVTRVCVCLFFAAFWHYCTDPDVNWLGGMVGVPSSCALLGGITIGAWVSLLREHSAEREMSATDSKCLYSLYVWFPISAPFPIYHHIYRVRVCLWPSEKSFTFETTVEITSHMWKPYIDIPESVKFEFSGRARLTW